MNNEASSPSPSPAGATPHPQGHSLDTLLPQVYEDLRQAARAALQQLRPGQTLQATVLVHEAYLRLWQRQQGGDGWQNPAHFFFAAARAMHDILVEHARAKASAKRGGGRERLDLDNLVIAHESSADQILAMSEALTELQQQDARKHQIVMLRFFAGCTAEEVAAAMDLSLRTIHREWRYARAWLHKRLSDTSMESK